MNTPNTPIGQKTLISPTVQCSARVQTAGGWQVAARAPPPAEASPRKCALYPPLPSEYPRSSVLLIILPSKQLQPVNNLLLLPLHLFR